MNGHIGGHPASNLRCGKQMSGRPGPSRRWMSRPETGFGVFVEPARCRWGRSPILGGLASCPAVRRRCAFVFVLLQSELLQGPMVPHLGFSEKPPVLERTKGSDLAAQGFHRAAVSEILHFICPPIGLPAEHLIPILRQRHYDSSCRAIVAQSCRHGRDLIARPTGTRISIGNDRSIAPLLDRGATSSGVERRLMFSYVSCSHIMTDRQ